MFFSVLKYYTGVFLNTGFLEPVLLLLLRYILPNTHEILYRCIFVHRTSCTGVAFVYSGINYLVHMCLNTGVHINSGLVFSASCTRGIYLLIHMCLNTGVQSIRKPANFLFYLFYTRDSSLLLTTHMFVYVMRIPVYNFAYRCTSGNPVIVFQNVHRTKRFF